jgi:trans-aconitate methyltransferase
MKVNWAERLIVNSPIRVLIQKRIIIRWIKNKVELCSGGEFLEIGCGRDAGSNLLLKEFLPAAVHTMDVDVQMIVLEREYR